jgi:hypothetical protein
MITYIQVCACLVIIVVPFAALQAIFGSLLITFDTVTRVGTLKRP